MQIVRVIKSPQIPLYAKVAHLQPAVKKNKDTALSFIHNSELINNLKVHGNGIIADGNHRFWHSWLNTDIEYLPVDIDFFTGMAPKRAPTPHLEPSIAKINLNDLSSGSTWTVQQPERFYEIIDRPDLK